MFRAQPTRHTVAAPQTSPVEQPITAMAENLDVANDDIAHIGRTRDGTSEIQRHIIERSQLRPFEA